MFYRVIQLQYAPDNRQAVLDYINSIEAKARQLDVLESGVVIETAEDESVAVMGYKSEDAYNGAAEQINALLGGLIPVLTGPPSAVFGHDAWNFAQG